MRLRNDERRYGALAQGLHWLIVALVLTMFYLGWTMDELPDGPGKLRTFNLHKSIGVTILALMLLRLAWRLASPPPPLPPAMPDWERRAATATHLLFYLLLVAQPLIGILHSNAANFPVVIYQSFGLPALIGPDQGLKEALGLAHGLTADAIAILVLLHIAAALRHHFRLKDDVLRRMLPGGTR